MQQAHKKSLLSRLRRIEGQVRGLIRLVEKDTYCIDVITQTSAIKSALSSVEDLLLENHLETCASNQIKSGNIKKAKQEILAVYRLKRK
ncbi:MAG: metal-sensitive transcriptional regulator [Candidatus Pacebacteria bacterium]|nr:metal-sensitive transcriptional regulator [Candidatus Paceibacterota bacterium]MBP9840248.1 metal-sensitive transcriptional regulator [Candidatus Paceibacterota bacterium]